jgi:hypoxanthine phosphoribosyltransferase
MEIGLIVFSVATGLVTLWGGFIQALDFRMSRKVARANEFPIHIARSISNSSYLRAIDQLRRYMDARRMTPQIIVGVHYGGMGHAAEIAKVWRLPVRQAEVELRYVGENQSPVCERVIPRFPLEELNGRLVLVVDNRIKSGRTLRSVVETLAPHAREIRTCVIHKPRADAGNFQEPDFVVFQSKRPLKNLLK